ncbi:10598_t:CDS:2 [Acaulospora colombiana]|uniref:10598_t:CDS:1 n=1 Tax=Acaulospora colombiana TaxID=27376 RepID=A0ACA9N4E7_9GLOM|nr:10598_t:CDS:2 [Acaulospora colombiana]
MFNNCASHSDDKTSNGSSPNPISNNFIDKISSRETSLILPDEFSGLERICLTANGNLQRILSAWFNKPVKIHVVKNIPIDNTNPVLKSFDNYEIIDNNCDDNDPVLRRYDREVKLVCENKTLCNAFSDVIVRDKKVVDLIENEGVGLGQLFR